MRQLLRSMVVADNDNDEEIFRNFIKFSDSGMGFESAHELRIWEIVQEFCQEHSHAPNAESVRGILKQGSDSAATDFFDILIRSPSLIKGDFIVQLEEESLSRKNRMVKDLINQATSILNTGIEVKDEQGKRILKGPIDAARHFYDRVGDIIAPTMGGKIFGEILSDAERGIKDYLTVKADPRAGIGQYSGLEQMDQALKGAKKHELWTHAAYTSHGKSLFARNWAYNQAVFMGYNVLYLSLEMPFRQIRNHFYAMHSTHSKFQDIRMELGIQKDPRIPLGIPYGLIREGELSPAEEVFLIQHVIPDLKSEESGYGSVMLEVGDPDKDEMTVNDLRSRAEMLHRKKPVDLLIVDHALLMSPRRRTKTTTEDLNQVLRDLKKMAMSFDRGAGVPVMCLFQISREGFKHAEKAGGIYNLTHLSYANECCAEGTKVATHRGWVNIEDVKIGDRVWSRTGWRDVLNTFNQGVRPTLSIHTTTGSFKVTPDHRLRVWDGSEIVWKYAHDLQEGDVIPTPSDYPGTGEEEDYSASYLKGVHAARGDTPIQALYFYGHYGLRMGIRRSIFTLFGEGSLRHNDAPSIKTNNLYQSLWNQPVPESLNHTACFLRGAMDGGGWVDKFGQILISVTDPESIVSRFRQIGVDARIRDSFVEIVDKVSVNRAARVCGFSHSPTQRDAYFSHAIKDFMVPLSDAIRARYRLSAQEAISDLDIEECKELAGMMLAKVVSVEDSLSLPVYDIEVTGDHEYMTEFHLAHNCERSSDIVTASWLDDNHKRRNRMQFQCLKVRDGGSFDPFLARVDFSVGRVLTCYDAVSTPEQQKMLNKAPGSDTDIGDL